MNQFIVIDKLDGISISTEWENGILVQGVTRGSGIEGEDITPNVRKMEGIPKQLKQNFTGFLRGEIILKRSIWKEHFTDKANPRNAASGLSKRFDGKGAEHLTIMMYQVASGQSFQTEEEQFEYLKKLGVVVPRYSAHKTIEEVIDIYNEYQKTIRDSLDYDIDGLVVRINDLSKQYYLGELNHRPKGAIAFKFDAESRETTLQQIIWQVGSTGRLTPVAEFDPVQLAGATVSRASLYNLAYINELRVGIGAKIIVARVHDVIPRVEEVSKLPKKIAEPPKNCPKCAGKIEIDGEYLRCINKAGCPAQALGRLKMWVSENNILEFGDKVLQKLLEAGLVKDVGDLYRLKAEQIANLERMGEKSAQNLVDVMDKHRSIALENLIGGLGIDNVATSTTKLVIKAGYDTLDKIYNMSVQDFKAIDGFGAIKAQAFYDGFRANKNRINDILDAGVDIKARATGNLNHKTFCFTGSMTKPRPELHKMVEEAGGEIKKSVGKGLDYLVIADPNSTSSKAQAARKFGTKLITEEEFLSML